MLCSPRRPTLAFVSEGRWHVNRLGVVSPFGVEQGAVQEYVNVCHNWRPGTWSKDTLSSLGYIEKEGDQATKPTLSEALASMR